MSIASTLGSGRRRAEARMTDRCTIGSTLAGETWDPATGTYIPDPSATVYTGRCRVKMSRSMSLEPDAGETTGVVIRPEIHIPADVADVAVGHRVRITSARHNPSLVGVVFRVTSLFRDSQSTAQRLECTESQ